MKYIVRITDTTTYEFEVSAKDKDEAYEIADEKFNSGDNHSNIIDGELFIDVMEAE